MSAIGDILDFFEAAVATINVQAPFVRHVTEGRLRDRTIDDSFHRAFEVMFRLDADLTGAHGGSNAELRGTVDVMVGYVGAYDSRELRRVIYDDHELIMMKLVAKIDPGYPEALELVIPLPASVEPLEAGGADAILVTAPFRITYWAEATS